MAYLHYTANGVPAARWNPVPAVVPISVYASKDQTVNASAWGKPMARGASPVGLP